MGAVSRSKGIIDINIRQFSQCFGHLNVVFLFFRMKAGIFQNQHIPRLQGCRSGFSGWANAVFRKRHRLAEQLC